MPWERSCRLCTMSDATRASSFAWICLRSASGILGPRMAGCPLEPPSETTPRPPPPGLVTGPALMLRSAAGLMSPATPPAGVLGGGFAAVAGALVNAPRDAATQVATTAERARLT